MVSVSEAASRGRFIPEKLLGYCSGTWDAAVETKSRHRAGLKIVALGAQTEGQGAA